MKRLGLITIGIIYLFSANALVHASFMGFFDHQQKTLSHCHQIQTTTDKTTSDQNNIDCCELVYSNEYSNTKLSIKTFCQKYFSIIETTNIDITTTKNGYVLSIIDKPPGRKTDNKFNNFSDLVGIIVNTI